MLYITTEDLQMVLSASKVIWKHLDEFTGEDREVIESFCRGSAKLEQRYEAHKEKQKEKMRQYRRDPRSADKVREYAKEAQRKHRAKVKAEEG